MSDSLVTKVKLEGRLIGYLPFEGVCEIEVDDGAIQCYGLSNKLTSHCRVNPGFLHPFLYKFLICELSDHDLQVIEHFEIHSERE